MSSTPRTWSRAPAIREAAAELDEPAVGGDEQAEAGGVEEVTAGQVDGDVGGALGRC